MIKHMKIETKAMLILCFSVFLFSGCQKQTDTLNTSTKGYELYTWRLESGVWYYALLPGTNRLKDHSELVVVQKTSLDDLEQTICSLAQGEYLFWNINKEQIQLPLLIPDKAVVDRIKKVCSEKNINLSIP
ncbi:MAG: hypothetical protein H9535_19505 [Ignavibacteria bacterium]|nr:hypothetical protein [Ignavibacteria bacterium]